MTNIEKQFFEAFGIEAIAKCVKPDIKRINPTFCEYYKNCTECDYYDYKYPSITNRVLLELICILNKHYCENYQCATMLIGLTLCEVKRCILTECLENEKHIRQQVRALFKEEK